MHIIRHWHSFIEIETAKWSYLIDPFINGNTKCDITLDDVYKKNVLWVFLTHGHGDHLGESIAIHREALAPVVCEYGLGDWFETLHGVKCIRWSLWGTVKCWDATIKFFHAPHGGGILDNSLAYKCISSWLLITIDGKSIYHAGDTSLTYDMKMLSEFHKVDVACVPIWDIYTMWIEDWARAIWFIKPTIAFPIHYDTWEPLRVDPIAWASLVMRDTKTVPKVLKPWQYVVLWEDAS
jgi:L-ascorbate metabolism protein UlaG (beta-lactamase superfamily)